MYALYRKSQHDSMIAFHFVEEISLFGCNRGFIPALLRSEIPPSQGAPFKWELDISKALASTGRVDHGLVIDLKPKNASPNLSLYEIMTVWGHSLPEWTPIMMRLRSLFVDETPADYNQKQFTRQLEDMEDPIFSMMYLAGTVEKGQLVGRWTAPGASPTNSVLLWPETFQFFASKAGEVIRVEAQQALAVGAAEAARR